MVRCKFYVPDLNILIYSCVKWISINLIQLSINIKQGFGCVFIDEINIFGHHSIMILLKNYISNDILDDNSDHKIVYLLKNIWGELFAVALFTTHVFLILSCIFRGCRLPQKNWRPHPPSPYLISEKVRRAKL